MEAVGEGDLGDAEAGDRPALLHVDHRGRRDSEALCVKPVSRRTCANASPKLLPPFTLAHMTTSMSARASIAGDWSNVGFLRHECTEGQP